MSIAPNRLEGVVNQLLSRPGHEMVRSLVHELCVVGLDVPANEVEFEVPVPEVRGRLDALFGATVFEFKRDLRIETADAEEQLTRYLADRERATQTRYLGIATDGADFVAYELSNGKLCRLNDCSPSSSDPRELLRWLDTAITVRADLTPDPKTIQSEFGRESLVFNRSMEKLRDLWEQAQSIPEADLKHALWSRHLEFVYGKLIDPDELFLQHTYLTIVAKTMAVRVLVSGPVSATEILEGTPFTQIGLNGAVEVDFFDWVLRIEGGAELVDRIAAQVSRFRLSEIKVDVLKAVYESLIDPQQRHYLGEYYTPDWLAERMCRETIAKPLRTRVLDPACGSGTFIFHAVRMYLDAAEEAELPLQDALAGCTDHITGLDVHPVAVLFARVTYLLAIGPERLNARTDELSIPVYLGDALQWDVRQLLTEEEIEITVPDEPPMRFPGSVAGDPNLLDRVLRIMSELADRNAPSRSLQSWMNANTGLTKVDRDILAESYIRMRSLHQEGRNHIWTYIVRNLTRPLWLSLRSGKPDLVIGNPPWLRYNAMSRELQRRFRAASQERGLWVGGKVATHQDLSAYFFARSVERYLGRGGRIAFVMPYAALSRAQYQGFRAGRYADRKGNIAAIVQFDEVWTFDSEVQPLFPVPAAVVFAHRDVVARKLPETVIAFTGRLPRRDANLEEARRALSHTVEPWPMVGPIRGGSPYRNRFKQGATIVPRRLMVVVPVEGGQFGMDQSAPLVTSRIGAHDKLPWKNLGPLKGKVEGQFLRPLMLGESIAPFRAFRPVAAVIPWNGSGGTLLDARSALEGGHFHLARWLETAERLWNKHRSSSMSLGDQLDYYGKLSIQFPIKPLRIVYAKAGARPTAAIVEDRRAVIDHKLYWMAVSNIDEANYLTAILNSEEARKRVEKMQSEGQFGPRDFDKVMFNLPITPYDSRLGLHQKLVKAGKQAERIATDVTLASNIHFQTVRRLIRNELSESGISGHIDDLVSQLLSSD